MKTEPIICVDKLSRRFGDFTAVDQISFSVERGEIFGFLGANGAGKTTAIRMLTGLLRPSAGEGKVAGFDIYQETESIKKNIGYMSQAFSLYTNLTVWENIEFFAGIYGMQFRDIHQKGKVLVQQLGMENMASSLVADIPMGWRQKLAFSVAIIHQPKLVFLDEPTGGVDPITRRQFWDLIYEATSSGITAFVTTHYMDEAEYCDRVSIMVDGRIAAMDSPSGLKDKYNVRSMDEVFYQVARNQSPLS